MKTSKEIVAEPKSKFSLSKGISIVPVKSGERVSNDTEPTIETASQFNKFKLNKLAAVLMGVVAGDRVKILITGEEGIDGRYLIAVADSNDNGAAKLMSPSKAEGFGGLLFNYAGVWSKIAQATVDAEEKSGKVCVEEGIAIARGTTFYLNQKATYNLVEVEDFNAENPLQYGTASYSKVFALVNPKTESVDLNKVVPSRKKDSTDEIEATTEA